MPEPLLPARKVRCFVILPSSYSSKLSTVMWFESVLGMLTTQVISLLQTFARVQLLGVVRGSFVPSLIGTIMYQLRNARTTRDRGCS